jgi:hypothetical protein
MAMQSGSRLKQRQADRSCLKARLKPDGSKNPETRELIRKPREIKKMKEPQSQNRKI